MIVSQIPNKKIKDRREKLTENVKLYQAAESDIEEITGLYEQAKGSKFCTWDEHYPKMKSLASSKRLPMTKSTNRQTL